MLIYEIIKYFSGKLCWVLQIVSFDIGSSVTRGGSIAHDYSEVGSSYGSFTGVARDFFDFGKIGTEGGFTGYRCNGGSEILVNKTRGRLFERDGARGSRPGRGPNDFMGGLGKILVGSSSGPVKAKTGDICRQKKLAPDVFRSCGILEKLTIRRNLEEGSKGVCVKVVKDDNIIIQGMCLIPIRLKPSSSFMNLAWFGVGPNRL
ncbi:hypothetical protein BVRB_6g143030 [Beta vulgaris subsp. vulgaris]|nr:hypothetical protein BVRB_6g143030 [Beta vulgaris subsp. vulgaris]